MVQNTLGRIWLDNNPGDSLEDKMQYLVPKAEDSNEDSIYRYDSLEDIKVIDPACGSGHILLEAFDLLYDMYLSEFYSREEAITCIFTQNLVGIDLDTRAKQLATFALLLKACQRDKSFLDVSVSPRVLDMPVCDSYTLKETLGHFLCAYQMEWNDAGNEELAQAFGLMKDADSLGSIMRFDISGKTRQLLVEAVAVYDAEPKFEKAFKPLVDGFRLILALTDKYACVIANPPYMGSGNMNEVLSKYVKDNYAEGKADLFSVFMLLAAERLADNGKYGMINMQSWMFLSSFENLRTHLLSSLTIDSMLHLGPRTFDELSGEVVQNTAFVVSHHEPTEVTKGTYYRLVDGKNCADKEQLFLSHIHGNEDGNRIFYPNVEQKNFEKIPGCPIGYWVSEKMISIFISNPNIDSSYSCREGIHTTDNKKYVRLWTEVDYSSISFGCSNYSEVDNGGNWVPYNKGGGFRRWYGINDYVVAFSKKYRDEMASLPFHVRPSESLYFKEGGTWSAISSGKFSIRYYPIGFLFDAGGQVAVGDNVKSLIGYLNSKVFDVIAKLTMPTINFKCGIVKTLPNLSQSTLTSIVEQNITISKLDWDSHETSWDFRRNPLWEQQLDTILFEMQERGVMSEDATIDDIESFYLPDLMQPLEILVENYKAEWEDHFMQLHDNEEELNRQFICIYGLEDELTPDVPHDEITILQQGEITIADNKMQWHDDVIIKQFISYAIGCMMGRYSIDKPGLILANQGDDVAQYNQIVPNSRFAIDDDGILPLMDDNSPFSDNAASRLAAFVKTAFGADHLTENLNYMEQALGKSLNEYLQKDFWKDHKRMYQSRPIYWLFASKKGAFRALVYMHRMDAYTVGKVRNQYLLPYIEWLKQRIDELMARQAELSAQERKQLKDYGKSLDECREYDVRLHEVANQQISIDLDDGVVVNYAKYGDVLQKLK